MNKDLLKIEGTDITIVLDENGPKGECYNKKNLMDILEQDNKIEFLENRINVLANNKENAEKSVETDKDTVRYLSIAQCIVTPIAFAIVLYFYDYMEFASLTKFFIGCSFPAFGFGMFEIPKIILKKDITKSEKDIDRSIVETKFLSDELAKEKENKKGKVTYRKKNRYIVELVDTTELDDCMNKYRNFSALYDSIPVVEAPEEKGKRISLKR